MPLNTRQLSEWIAYFNVHPFGEYRNDLNTGLLRQTIIAVNATKGSKVPSLDKLLLPECIGIKKRSAKDPATKAAFMAWAMAARSKGK